MTETDIIPAAEKVLSAARAKGWHIGTAESCTGGLIAGALTAIAGSSDVVEGGFVTYSNAAKTQLLGVPADDIVQFGAVGDETARAMAAGVLAKLPSVELAVSVTGIAGPGGGSPTKPVGLVHFGLALRGQLPSAYHEIFAGDRTAIRQAAVLKALDLLYQAAR